MLEAVLGFRPHTYWTAVAALAGPVEAPQVIERRRIVFAVEDERFVYHQAAELELSKAEALIAEVRASTSATAAHEFSDLVATLETLGFSVRQAVTAAVSGKAFGAIQDIIAAHARMHGAEGDFYREVVAGGCERAGLKVHRVVERDIPVNACRRLGLERAELDERLKRMGDELGPPWSEDYRLAVLAAWLHLADG